MAVRTSTSTSSWQRRLVVLVTALATALGLAALVGAPADAAKPVPPPDGPKLVITKVLDADFTLPASAAPGSQDGLIRPGLPFSVSVQSQTAGGQELIVTNGDLKVALSGGGVNAVLTIQKGSATGTLSGLVRSGTSNFVLGAAGPKNSGYQSDTIPVHIAVESAKSNGLAAGQTLNVQDATGADCVLSSTNPTCVSLSVSGGAVGNVVLTTSECAGFLGVTDCHPKKGNSVLAAQTLVDLTEGQVATATLYCDKSQCGQGGVAQHIPLVDKGNTGTFTLAEECPEKGVIGADQGICVDLRSSTRFNAGDLATVILFDSDARMIH